ncbi:unnamed protein product [Urochloa humidicola]
MGVVACGRLLRLQASSSARVLGSALRRHPAARPLAACGRPRPRLRGWPGIQVGVAALLALVHLLRLGMRICTAWWRYGGAAKGGRSYRADAMEDGNSRLGVRRVEAGAVEEVETWLGVWRSGRGVAPVGNPDRDSEVPSCTCSGGLEILRA